MVVGSLFGTSCVPVLHFVQPPPHNVRLSTAFSITVSLSVRQPTQLRLLLINANDLKPHKRFTIQPKQSPRFIQSTTYKFEGLRIEEMAVHQQHSLVTSMESELSTEAGSCMNGTDSLNGGNIPEKCNEADWSDTQKSNAKIMIEASSPNASVTLLSDEITIDNEPFVFVELSHQVIEKPNETVWVLLNKEPTELNVVLSDGKRVEPVDAVKLYGKLVIFTLPSQMHPTSDTAEKSRQLPQTANVVNGADEFESNDSKDVLRTAEESSKEQRNSAEELGSGNGRTVAEVADSKATVSDAGAAGSSSTDPTAIPTAKQPSSTNEMESESKTTAETVVESSPEVIAAHGNTPLSLTNLKIILQCGKQQIILPVRFQLSVTNTTEVINNEEFRSTQLSSLFNFASGGDPLALLSPFAHLLNETDSDGCNALHISARNKQNFALRTLLTALRESCAASDVAQVVNAQNLRGQTPLHCAVRAGDADCVHYLLNAGASYDIPDNNFDTVIHYLGEVYNDAIYKEILEQSHFDSSEQQHNGQTAESVRAESSSPQTAASATTPENPLSAKNASGYTPAHIAVQKLKLGLLEALVEVGAPLDTPDEHGETPLICALLMDDIDTASLLISNNCNPNAVSKDNDTPLGIACRKKNLVLIGRLIDAGADLEMPDKCGKKAAEYGDEDEDVKKILNGERIQTEETSSALQANDALASEATASHGNDSEDDALLSYRIRSLNTDDISAMDYLTRLRLAKLLDSDEKWIILADHLGCGHMVEFIRVCTDETSSPTMILLDQYEQMPNANLATVRQALEDMGEMVGVRLLRTANEQE